MTMRMINKKYLAILASAGLLAVISCEKTEVTVKGGDEILFSAETEGCENVDTKATYGGDASRYTKDTKTYEPIYWENGDLIRITCAQAAEVQSADYVISKVYSDKKQADISLYSPGGTAKGLRWQDNDESIVYKFFSAYPSPEKSGVCKSINGYYIQGILPQNGNQNTLSGALKNDGNDNYTLTPDLKWQLMIANSSYTHSTFPEDGTAFLKFTPLTTAIQFTITNSVDKDLEIKELDLISTGNRISGRFDITNFTDLDTDGFPKMTLKEDAYTGDTVKLVLSSLSSPVTIKKNKTFTFTFFLVPVVKEISDLKFRIVRGGADDGATMTTRIGYTDGTYCKFPRCKKSFVKGIMTPEGVQWTIDYAPELTDWIDGGENPITLY